MSVRFQYSGDKNISVERSSGASIFALPAGGFPAAGSYNSTTNLNYIQGTYYNFGGTNYYEKNADYIVKNDGAGGTYVDFYTASNITYNTGTIYTSNNEQHNAGYVSTPCGSEWTYTDDGYTYSWTGSGGYNTTDSGQPTTGAELRYTGLGNGYSICQNALTTYVFDANYANGKTDEYIVNGHGSFYINYNTGSYISYNTYIVTDYGNNVQYYWDGNGGYFYV